MIAVCVLWNGVVEYTIRVQRDQRVEEASVMEHLFSHPTRGLCPMTCRLNMATATRRMYNTMAAAYGVSHGHESAKAMHSAVRQIEFGLWMMICRSLIDEVHSTT